MNCPNDMRRIAIFFALILIATFTYGQNWTDIPLSGRLDVKFPSKPEVNDTFENVTFYRIADSTFIINVSVSKLKRLANNRDTLTMFYRWMIDGKIADAWQGKLLNERKVTLGKYEGLEVDYTRFFDGIYGVFVTARVIEVDGVLFTFDFFDLKKTDVSPIRKKFLNSVHLN